MTLTLTHAAVMRASRNERRRLAPRDLLSVLVVCSLSTTTIAADKPSVGEVTAKIDGFMESHWSALKLQPTAQSDDATFLRRVTLDLVGRIPTTRELDQFLSDKSKDKRTKTTRSLMDGPEFPLHWGSVLDQMIQTRYSGNASFVDYLRKSVRDNKTWDVLFRELMLGPWDTAEMKPANRFLDKRAKASDVLTVDATRVFFGVDISCAKCHDHPLVEDWKQDHFYGMVSFFNRTTGGKGKIGEKNDGDVKFLGMDGKEQVAKVMFLSGDVVDDAPNAPTTTDKDKSAKPISRRELLVKAALTDRKFFSRSLVNRVWLNLFGRGLVHPVDQMHSGNSSAVPGLLEWLADDFADGGYDLHRLIAALVNSRAYQLSSVWTNDGDVPAESAIAVMSLRPLSRRQLSFSLLLATGNEQLTEPDAMQSRVEQYINVPGAQRISQYIAIEQRAASLTSALDRRDAEFQSSAVEALFMSNNSATQELIAPNDDNLPAQLGKIEDTGKLITTAIRSVLNRPPEDAELAQLTEWFDQQKTDRSKTAGQLIWVLVTSAEFRFNH